MYKCKHFAPSELVPEQVYHTYPNKDDIYALFDEKALRILDMIREWAGVPLTVNNWKEGGVRSLSGFRPKTCAIGAPKSAHKLGKAFDVISPRITTPQLWTLIQQHAGELPCKIRIERTSAGKPISWLHFDTNTAPGQQPIIYFFNA